MHEMAIARRLVIEALERMEDGGGQRLTDVEVVLGSAARLSPVSVRLHFQLAARGTPAERAELHVTWEPGRYSRLLQELQVKFETAVVETRSAIPDRLADAVVSWDADLLVIGSRVRSGPARALLGGGRSLRRVAPVPVLVARRDLPLAGGLGRPGALDPLNPGRQPLAAAGR